MSAHGEKLVPRGELLQLKVQDLKTSVDNPRQLFDKEPLDALKNSIRLHGVLVPLTVYKMPGAQRYGIVDGERRYRCCFELSQEGVDVVVPANVVSPPDAMASLVYMFNIHSFREQWELMPTAIGLKRIIEHLGGQVSDEDLHQLTGLSDPQIRRCRIILSFPQHYQQMSLEVDPAKRIPSNFWIELFPILELAEKFAPNLISNVGRDGVTDKLVEKYRARKIKSVVHFRRIVEAFQASQDDIERVTQRFCDYVNSVQLETRAAFDEFIVDARRKQKVVDACSWFISELEKARVDAVAEAFDREELVDKLKTVISTASDLIDRLQIHESDIENSTDG